jgi:hypothetical protein
LTTELEVALHQGPKLVEKRTAREGFPDLPKQGDLARAREHREGDLPFVKGKLDLNFIF